MTCTLLFAYGLIPLSYDFYIFIGQPTFQEMCFRIKLLQTLSCLVIILFGFAGFLFINDMKRKLFIDYFRCGVVIESLPFLGVNQQFYNQSWGAFVQLIVCNWRTHILGIWKKEIKNVIISAIFCEFSDVVIDKFQMIIVIFFLETKIAATTL